MDKFANTNKEYYDKLRKEQSPTKISKGICTELRVNKPKTKGTEKKSRIEKTSMN